MAIRPPVPPDDDDHGDDTGALDGDALHGDAPGDSDGDGSDGDDFDPTVPPEPLDGDELHAAGREGLPAAAVEWRVDQRMTVVKLVLAAIFVAGPWLVGASAASRLVGLVAGLALAAFGLRDVLAPVRLRVDSTGVRVVTGYAGHRDLRWSELDRVRLDARSRLGLRTELLEVDAGESLYFFSRYDLGEPPVDVLTRIRRIRGAGG